MDGLRPQSMPVCGSWEIAFDVAGEAEPGKKQASRWLCGSPLFLEKWKHCPAMD